MTTKSMLMEVLTTMTSLALSVLTDARSWVRRAVPAGALATAAVTAVLALAVLALAASGTAPHEVLGGLGHRP